MEKGATIYNSQNGEKGIVITGIARKCRLEGCSGFRYAVRWPDGKLTYPCSKGILDIDVNTYRII